MARSSGRRDLFLQVSGNVDPLKASMKAGQSVLAEFGNAAVNVQAVVERALGNLGANAPAQAKQMERAYDKTFAAIRANAKAVMEATPAGAVEILNVAGARQAAEAAEQQAAALRMVATAAAQADTAAGGNNAELRILAVSTEVAAQEATQYATALRGQANALSGVEANIEGVTAAQRRAVPITGQARAGMQQLSFQMGDVATQFAAGTPPAIIFAQQIGQVTQAIGMMTTNTKGFLGFIGGPWGMALSSALVVLTPLVGKLFEESEASKEATKQKKKHKEALDALIEAQGKAVLSTEAKLRADFVALESERLRELQIRKTTAALLEQAKVRLDEAQARAQDPTLAGEGGYNPGAAEGARIAGEIGDLNARLKKNDERIAALTTSSAQAAGRYITSIVDAKSTPEGDLKRSYQLLRDAAESELERTRDFAKYAKTKARLNEAEERDLKALQEKQAADKKRQSEAKKEPSLPKVTDKEVGASLVESFGGSFSGKRTPEQNRRAGGAKNSYHLSGQAVDFIPRGGMGSVTRAEIRARLEAEGVNIRELLGPGDKGHDDHFHIAFDKKRAGADQIASGRATAANKAEAEAQREIAEDIRFGDEKRKLSLRLLDLQGRTAANAETRLKLNEEEIEVEADAYATKIRQLQKAGKLEEAEAAELIAANDKVKAQRKINLKIEEATRVFDRQAEAQSRSLDFDIQMLRMQLDLATTTAERERIARELLAAEQKQRRQALEAAKRRPDATEEDVARADAELKRLPNIEAGEREKLRRDEKLSPMDEYRKRLEESLAGVDERLEEIKVRAIGDLEDDLAGAAMRALGLKGALAGVVEELIRIGLQKAALALLGLGDGGGGTEQANATAAWNLMGGIKGMAGGGMIRGPGTGTSDSILAFAGNRPIRVANGEYVINAQATAEYLPLIEAINARRLPGLAAGGMPLPSFKVPRIPQLPKDLGRGGAGGISVSVPISLHAPGADPAQLARLESAFMRAQSELPSTILTAVADAQSRGTL